MDYQYLINTHLKKRTVISVLLSPFSFVYAIIVVVRRLLYRTFPTLSYKSKFQIISVGNITSGGTGKTPFALYLANKFILQGHKVAIVLRGYKGQFEHNGALIADDKKVFEIASKAGDEAMLYVNNLPHTPICVGKNRVKSVKLLEDKFPDLDIVILDDGFQYLKLKQDVKYCIFSSENPIGNGFCLPAGLLREPIFTLKWVDYIVINGTIKPNIDNKLLKIISTKQILSGNYIINEIVDYKQKTYTITDLKTKKLMLLSGIGTPKSFEKTVEQAGLSIDKHLCLNDHFEYTQEFIDIHIDEFVQYDFVLTTEKDFTKLSMLKIEAKVLVVKVRFDVVDQ